MKQVKKKDGSGLRAACLTAVHVVRFLIYIRIIEHSCCLGSKFIGIKMVSYFFQLTPNSCHYLAIFCNIVKKICKLTKKILIKTYLSCTGRFSLCLYPRRTYNRCQCLKTDCDQFKTIRNLFVYRLRKTNCDEPTSRNHTILL